MTISYSDKYFRILFLWRGSVYKAVIKEAIAFLSLWYAVFLLNQFVFSEVIQKVLTQFSERVEIRLVHLPLSFLLGFFVNNGVHRWWDQAKLVEGLRTERLLATIDGSARHSEYRVDLLTKVGRWANLMCALAWRRISGRTKKRFPTDQHLVDAGLMTQAEFIRYDQVENRHGKWMVPFYWMVNRLKMEKAIEGEEFLACNKAMSAYVERLRELLNYDWMKIPLLYVQIATIATYVFLIMSVLSNQNHLDRESRKKPDYQYSYFPLFGFIQVIFYMGWLKVGQFLSNPFGEDDDDFEMNYILDRNIRSTWLFVEQSSEELPPDDQDAADMQAFLDRSRLLPHTKASIKIKDVEPPVHTDDIRLSKRESEIIRPAHQSDMYTDPAELHGGVGYAQNKFISLLENIRLKKRNNEDDGTFSAPLAPGPGASSYGTTGLTPK